MKWMNEIWPLGLGTPGWRRTVAAIGIGLVLFGIMDDRIAAAAAQSSPDIVQVFSWITRLGMSDWILIPTLAFALVAFVNNRLGGGSQLDRAGSLSVFIFFSVGLSGLVSNFMKRSIGRARPEVAGADGGFFTQPFAFDHRFESFPSGHATTSFALACVVGFLWPRFFPLAFAGALVIGLSRVIVGAHFPSDVLGGAVVGTLGAFAVRNFFAWRGWVFVFEGGSVHLAADPAGSQSAK